MPWCLTAYLEKVKTIKNNKYDDKYEAQMYDPIHDIKIFLGKQAAEATSFL